MSCTFSFMFYFQCQRNNVTLGILLWHGITRISMAKALFNPLHSFLPHHFSFTLYSTVTIWKRQHILRICGLMSRFYLWYKPWIIHWNALRILKSSPLFHDCFHADAFKSNCLPFSLLIPISSVYRNVSTAGEFLLCVKMAEITLKYHILKYYHTALMLMNIFDEVIVCQYRNIFTAVVFNTESTLLKTKSNLFMLLYIYISV